jgi:hypothetical protein
MPMPRYLLIESRDPFDSNDVHFCCGLAQQLVAAKNEVTLFLVQNGVFPARSGARSDDLVKLAGAGVRVLADSFSLRERGIDERRLAIEVPPDKILQRTDNPTGRAVACLRHFNGHPVVRCFVRPPES